MQLGVLYALLCLLGTALNDFVFKLYARKKRPQGIFVCLIGVIWVIYLLCTTKFSMNIHVSETVFWGCVSGFFSAGGNILLIASMSVLSGGLCSTIYRLNLVPVIFGAWLFLGETLTLHQWIGAVFALAAVIAFFPWGEKYNDDSQKKSLVVRAFIMIILASLMRAGMGLSYRYGFQHGADRAWVTLINAAFWVFGGFLFALFRERHFLHNMKGLHVLRYGVISGIMVAVIVLFMSLSLQYGEASIVLPIAQMSFLATWLMGRLFLHEKFNWRILLALLCGAAAVILLAL